MEIIVKHTRFRAYQLQTKGSSFSYWNGSHFTLGEARYSNENKKSILHELRVCGKTSIDLLHITSWDSDHCCASELELILKELKPKRIEYPGYEIDKNIQNQVDSLKLILDYEAADKTAPKRIRIDKLDNDFFSKLDTAADWDYTNILYNNKKDYAESNNNSSIKLFKSGCFTVLSLGDLEKEEISKWLISHSMILNEVDILLLAHHGSDNGFTSDDFLKAIKPKLAISLSNWDNQHGHPDAAVLKKLSGKKINYHSTKQGDIIIESVDGHTQKYKVWDFISDGEKLKDYPESYLTKRGMKAALD